jgi:phosphatidylglycerol---prolipoprotein diacylglyceryl transferase
MFPILFQSNDLIIYSYPFFMGLGWGIAYQIFFSLVPPTQVKRSLVLFWGSFISAWVGAKILFYVTAPTIDSSFLQETSFWLGGGFVFYGGFLGVLLFLFILKILNYPLSGQNLWPMVPALSFGHAVGRVGCLLAGCCFGKETDWWWGVHLHEANRHPTQLLEAAGLVFLGLVLLKTKAHLLNKTVFYLVGYGVLRFFIEHLRGDLIRGSWGFLTPSQWISLGLILSGFVLLIGKFKGLRGFKLK